MERIKILLVSILFVSAVLSAEGLRKLTEKDLKEPYKINYNLRYLNNKLAETKTSIDNIIGTIPSISTGTSGETVISDDTEETSADIWAEDVRTTQRYCLFGSDVQESLYDIQKHKLSLRENAPAYYRTMQDDLIIGGEDYTANVSIGADITPSYPLQIDRGAPQIYIGNSEESYTDEPYNLAYNSYSEEHDLGGLWRVFFINEQGTKLYVARSRNSIREYDITTPYDLSTISYVQGINLGIAYSVNGICFKPDGKRFYLLEDGVNEMSQYDLSIPWDLSTYSKAESWTILHQHGNYHGLDFAGDGRYVIYRYTEGTGGDAENRIGINKLTNRWDISGVESTTAEEQTIRKGLFLAEDGSYYLTGHLSNGRIYKYNLTTAFDMTTSTLSATYDLSAFENELEDIRFSDSGSKFYTLGSEGDSNNITEINVGTSTSIDYTEPFYISVIPEGAFTSKMAFGTNADYLELNSKNEEVKTHYHTSVPTLEIGGAITNIEDALTDSTVTSADIKDHTIQEIDVKENFDGRTYGVWSSSSTYAEDSDKLDGKHAEYFETLVATSTLNIDGIITYDGEAMLYHNNMMVQKPQRWYLTGGNYVIKDNENDWVRYYLEDGDVEYMRVEK